MQLETKNIFRSLQNVNRPELAKILGEVWEMSVSEYAHGLWEKPVSPPLLETGLREAFEKEFYRIGYSEVEAKALSASLERTRVLQTATHLTASEGPTFLALHHLSLLGLPVTETYFVGAYSGVPFANAAWSGCLNFSDRFDIETVLDIKAPGFAELKRAELDRSRDSIEKRISLMPGSMRDSRVYQSKVPERLSLLLPYINEPVRKYVPAVKQGDEFTTWASQFSAAQMRQIVPGKSIVYFDLNEVIRAYLILVLKNSQHPMFRILFEPTTRKIVLNEFSPETPLFIVEVQYKNKIRQETVVFKDDMFQSQNFQLEISPEKIIKELESGTLCPGLFLTFTTLCFINALICFGSFEQVEYLAEFRQKWLKLDFLEQEIVSTVNTSAFTSGLCIEESGIAVNPLDLLLGFRWSFKENQTVGELMRPLLPRLGVEV